MWRSHLLVREKKVECSYLGHVVGGWKVYVKSSKIEAIKKMQPLKMKKEVQTFLRLAG